MCADILGERTRIGGDWVVAGIALNSASRDFIRYALQYSEGSLFSLPSRTQLGRELVFVVLSMAEEEVRARLLDRHRGHKQFAEVLLVVTLQHSSS